MPNHLRLVASRTSKEEGRRVGRVRRILLAEDDAEMRRVIADALRKDGHDVLEVADSRQLLAELVREHRSLDDGRQPIDLILTDVRMPGCSGLEIMEVLMEAEWSTPTILMTAFGDGETRARAAKLGAVMLDKPFPIDVLLTTVRTSLR